MWFARVVRGEPENPLSNAAAIEQTQAYIRQNGPGQGWQELPPVAGRATAMASSSSQLVLLMADGQWLSVWSDGSATGQPLPAGGKILTLADDGENLWSIGAVAGGRAAADEAIVKELAATRPTTSPVIPITAAQTPLSADESTTQPAPDAELVLFRQDRGRWKTFAELPRDALLLSEGNVSLTIVGGSPVVSYKLGKNTIRTLRWDTQGRWVADRAMEPAAEPIDDFKLFTDGNKPLLWWTSGHSVGEISIDAVAHSQPIKLDWKSTGPTDNFEGVPAVTFSGGFIRVLRLQGRNIFEQRYEENGELLVPADAGATSHVALIEAVFLVAVAFSVGASVYRQWTQSQGTPTQTEPPPPAPLLTRFLAGLIDLVPVIAVGIYVYVSGGVTFDPGSSPSPAMLELCAGAIAVYLLHTTVLEILTSRSAGKWVFGLKVVTVDGQQPAVGQILIRNLLRLVDPLVMILVSPLRQRSADVVAGTMVIRIGDLQTVPVEPGANTETAGKDSE
jgi:uncharacterized RDD family membrane protein YckC